MKHPFIHGCDDIFINLDESRKGSDKETIVIISELADTDLRRFLIQYELYEKLV